MGDESFCILFAGCEALLRVIKNNDKLAELDLSGMIDLKSDVRFSGVFELFFEVLPSSFQVWHVLDQVRGLWIELLFC
jgi:hypothetical protein